MPQNKKAPAQNVTQDEDNRELADALMQEFTDWASVADACKRDGELRRLLFDIVEGRITTKKQCFLRYKKYPTYFRGEVKRVDSKFKNLKPVLLTILNRLI
jgi:hypothetical protein